MAEETQEQLQGSQVTPPAEGSTPSTQEAKETSQDQAQVPENQEKTDEQPQHSEDQQDGKSEDQAGQAKQTRGEKRIQSLLTKLKETNSQEVVQQANQQIDGIFTADELASGEVDFASFNDRLQKFIDQKVNAAKSEVVSTVQSRSLYSSKVNEFVADTEQVKFEDPALEELAVEQFNAINYQVNPLTQERDFIPAVKLSEIKAKLEKGIKIAAEKLVQQNKAFAKSVSDNQTVPIGNVGSSRSVADDTTDFRAFEKAHSK